MKLSLPFLSKNNSQKKKAPKAHKKFRVDARRYWVIMLSSFVLLLAAELVYFSLLFLHTGTLLDAPANPQLDTNDTTIRHMQQKLDAVDAAVKARMDGSATRAGVQGATQPAAQTSGQTSSQTNASVVQ